jgi:hypothetical protein
MLLKQKKQVRFSDENTIQFTHSSTDYDRSCFANITITNISIPIQPLIHAPIVHSLKRPKHKLKINTQFSQGPLYLTGLSIHQYHKDYLTPIDID